MSSSRQCQRQNHHHHRNNRRQEDDQEMIMPTLPTRNRVVVEHYITTTVKKGPAAPPPPTSPMIMMQTPPPPAAMSDDDDDDDDSGDNNDVENDHRNNNNNNNNNNDRGIPQVLQSMSTHSHKKKETKLKVTNTAADAKTACTTSTTISSCNNSLGTFAENNNLTYQERIKHYNNTMGRPNPTNTVINKNPKTKSGKKAAAQQQQSQQQQQQQSVYTEGTRAKTIVPLLALQAYHLPGNNWCQDWRQYMTNNHPVFGICCHHPLHPIGACTRIIALIAYCIFGLAITNFFYLFLLLNPELNRDVITISFGNDDDVDQTYVLTTGMLLLWTVGGSIHALYNLVMWHIAACACCRTGGCCESIACCPSFGKRLVRVFLFISIILAVVIVLLRVGIAQQEDQLQDDEDMAAIEESVANNNTTTGEPGSSSSSSSSITINIFDDDAWDIDIAYEAQEFNFLIGYLVEMVLALFIYYPLGGTILFSGVLGCGCIPLLGGRPAEVKAEKRKLEQQLRQKEQQQRSGGGGMNDLENNNNDGIELIFSPQAVREFDERR